MSSRKTLRTNTPEEEADINADIATDPDAPVPTDEEFARAKRHPAPRGGAVSFYIAVVDRDADSATGAWFPDVPGCFSAADDPGDIVSNAAQALSLHLAGETLPEARGPAELASDPEVAAALKDGAFLLGIPLVTAR